MMRATQTYINAHQNPNSAYNGRKPANTANALRSSLNMCHASVRPTKMVVEPGKRGPANGSALRYLFRHDIVGSQKRLFEN